VTSQPIDFEYRVRMRDGSNRWFESRARAMDGGAKPMVDVTYKRVNELPGPFKKMAAAK